ncbi:hypothetical protein Nepgr_032501 [Nepenthes gracilis]|uniref:Integrase zinc-binding domain-containing protein n=1 Tax=Nepenthes gracilis TaxID=150966 RepID=A0AAD3Y634_NEPGR|nr:hypothetical protein Nepgr_032501 [Nepenthes gracilis]
MSPYRRYIIDHTLLESPEDVKHIKKKANWYTIVDEKPYRHGYSTSYRRCLTPKKADYKLSKVHLGICGSHIVGKNIAFKIIQQGYYWPVMKQDTMKFVKKCENCQVHSSIPHSLHMKLPTLQASWTFAQ